MAVGSSGISADILPVCLLVDTHRAAGQRIGIRYADRQIAVNVNHDLRAGEHDLQIGPFIRSFTAGTRYAGILADGGKAAGKCLICIGCAGYTIDLNRQLIAFCGDIGAGYRIGALALEHDGVVRVLAIAVLGNLSEDTGHIVCCRSLASVDSGFQRIVRPVLGDIHGAVLGSTAQNRIKAVHRTVHPQGAAEIIGNLYIGGVGLAAAGIASPLIVHIPGFCDGIARISGLSRKIIAC